MSLKEKKDVFEDCKEQYERVERMIPTTVVTVKLLPVFILILMMMSWVKIQRLVIDTHEVTELPDLLFEDRLAVKLKMPLVYWMKLHPIQTLVCLKDVTHILLLAKKRSQDNNISNKNLMMVHQLLRSLSFLLILLLQWLLHHPPSLCHPLSQKHLVFHILFFRQLQLLFPPSLREVLSQRLFLCLHHQLLSFHRHFHPIQWFKNRFEPQSFPLFLREYITRLLLKNSRLAKDSFILILKIRQDPFLSFRLQLQRFPVLFKISNNSSHLLCSLLLLLVLMIRLETANMSWQQRIEYNLLLPIRR